MKQSYKVIRNSILRSISLVPSTPSFSLIWLHGLGDSADGFKEYFEMPQSPLYKGCKITLLTAPCRPVTINGGMPCNSWYDIRTLTGYGDEQQRASFQQLGESMRTVEEEVQKEITFWQDKYGKSQDVPNIARQVFVGGFSQGCAVSLATALTMRDLLGGIVGYSGYLFQTLDLRNKGEVPMLLYHGKQDEVIQERWARQGYERQFKGSKGYIYKAIARLEHSVTVQQLQQTTQWMLQLLQQYGLDHDLTL